MAVQIMKNSSYSQRISHNEKVQGRREYRRSQNNIGQRKKGTINMSELSVKADTVLMRKQLARKRAMKVVSDAWAGDKKIDAGLDESRAHIQSLKEDIYKDKEVVMDCMARKAALKEQEGLSPEEYEQRIGEIDAILEVYQGNIDSAENQIIGENASIRATRIERLKHHGMVGAQKEADSINEAASKVVIGMLIGEAKDHVDESLEEKQEAAKEKAEEKEEQEEKLEEQRTEKEQLQEQLEIKREENKETEEAREAQRENAREQAELLENAQMNYTDSDSLPSQVKQEIKDMLQKMKLLDEDLKGAKVDSSI